MARIGVAGLLAALALFLVVHNFTTFHATARTGTSNLGAVVSASEACTQIGIQTLKRGGNAADAAVATEFCLGVTYMWIAGLGSGGYAVVRGRDGATECVDFRETAPRAASRDMFQDHTNTAVSTGLAVAVPGELRGLEFIHNKYGLLPWADLIHPSVRLARDGFIVSDILASAINDYVKNNETYNVFAEDAAWAKDFAVDGRLLQQGDTFRNPRYANLLDRIAREGATVFYTGEIADQTVAAIQGSGGILDKTDLQSYSIVTKPAINIEYFGYTLRTCGASAGGGIVLFALKLLESYGTSDTSDQNLTAHRLDEAMRFAYALRARFGDPSFNAGQDEYEREMLGPAFIEFIKSKIHDDTTMPITAYNPERRAIGNTHGTSHMAAADASGMAVSLTSTPNLAFGSKIMVPENALILNNEMDDFSIPGFSNSFGYVPSPENFVVAGKRPLSSMSPLIVEHRSSGAFAAALGAAGGSRIITAVIQIVRNLLDLGMEVEEALKAPRLHDQLLPEEVIFETTYNSAVVHSMRDKGHHVIWGEAGSEAHAIQLLSNGTFKAAAEPRLPHSSGMTT